MLHIVFNVLEAAPRKTESVQSPAFHLTSHSSKTNKIYEAPLEKQGQTHKQHSLMDASIWICQYWPTSKDLQDAN